MHSAQISNSAPSPALRPIDAIYSPPPVHWVGDGFRVAGYLNAIPDGMRRLSPFLLLDYHPPHVYEATRRPRGVGVHPHRGFETVTIAWEGAIAHHDSTGAGGVIRPGDVPWMTAAAGILHKEFHEAAWAEGGGTLHLAQLWVNLPRAQKLGPPGYQPLTAEAMGRVDLADGAGHVRIIAGEFAGVRGPARTATKVSLFDVKLVDGARLELPAPAHETLAVLVIAGAVTVNGGMHAPKDALVLFGHTGDAARFEARGDTHLLVLGGEPIDEPIAAYGPFVMSTREELVSAVEDFQAGKFGHLAD